MSPSRPSFISPSHGILTPLLDSPPPHLCEFSSCAPRAMTAHCSGRDFALYGPGLIHLSYLTLLLDCGVFMGGHWYFISVASALSTAICYRLTDKWIYIINSSQEVTIKIYFWDWEIAQKCLSIWDFGRKALWYLSDPRTKLELLLFCFSSLNSVYIGLEQMNVNSLISKLWTVWVVQLFRNVKIHTLNGEISNGDRNYILIILLLSEITSCFSLPSSSFYSLSFCF